MAELLQPSIAKVSKVSDEQQDAITNRLLTELEDEQAWAITDTQWGNLAALLQQEMGSFPFVAS